MAALYQIAQSDPPQLLTENKWSDKLMDLVSSMLQKEPEMRPTPQQALQHDYFTGAEDKPDIIVQLIRKTKKFIEEEDDIRHKRIQRILRDLPGSGETDFTGSLGSQRSDQNYSDIDIDSDIESHVSFFIKN